MKRLFSLVITTLLIMVGLSLIVVNVSAIDETVNHNHTTNNGKCTICNKYIVEKDCKLKIRLESNANIGNISVKGTSHNVVLVDENRGVIFFNNVIYYYECVLKFSEVEESTIILESIVNDGNFTKTQYYTYDIVVIPHTHNYECTATVEPSCSSEGYKTYSCECGDSYNDTIPKVAHTIVIDNAINATCTTQGKTEGSHCSVCNLVIEPQDTIMPNGHKEVPLKAVAATCTTNGKTAGSYCSVCNTIIKPQETINATGHKAVTLKAVAATCTKTGKTTGTKCFVCGKILKAQETIAKKNHSYKNTIYKANATNKKNGKIVSVCSVCKAKKTICIYYPKTITLSYSKTTYTGKRLKPKVIVKDSNGKTIASSNYDVSYSNNKDVGTANVSITFKGSKYKGKVLKSFIISPKGTWVCGYSVDDRTLTFFWDKPSKRISGYELQYSTSKKFKKGVTKTIRITNPNTVLYDVGVYKRNTVYYARIRTYKIVDKKTYYSDWQMSPDGQQPPYKCLCGAKNR